jgi:hypothetical protein
MNFVALMNMERDNKKRSCRGFVTHHRKDQDEQERKNTERERDRETESLLKVVKGRVFEIFLMPMCKH